MVTSQGLLQSAFARNAAGAQEYLATTAMTTGVMSDLAAPGGLAPAWVDSYAVAASDPVIKGFGTYADTSAPMPNLAEMDQVWPSLSRAQVDVMSGANPTKTMKAAGSEIQSAIDAS
jgi:maltose-binding protein MalE